MRTLSFATTALLAISPLAAQAEKGQDVKGQDVQPLAPERHKGFESIDVKSCKEWLTYLSSDELGGRETGRPGYKLAADFIAKKFKEFGLKPVGDKGTYFQAVPFSEIGADPDKSSLAFLTEDGDSLMKLVPGKGFGGSIAENSERECEVVELVAEKLEDVRNADIQGKAVLFTDKTNNRMTRWNLQRARPAAILLVDDNQAKSVLGRIVSGGRNRAMRGRGRRPNTYAITSDVAKKLRAAMKKHETLMMKANIVVTRKPAFAANVIGFLEGRDKDLKHEIVGIGSHLDHIGKQGSVINNGADDDGSGTTGVLAVARAFALNSHRPRRSILFMCFSGEEKGLIGSRHYVNNPIFPNDKMVAELQMDMIGRNEEVVNRRTGKVTEKPEDNVNSVHLVGSKKLSMDLHNICIDLNKKHIGLDYEYDEEDVFSRSDHANFARKDIPIAFFFTGFHPQYHRPDDTVDKINFEKLVRVAKLVYAIGFEVADREEPIKRDRTWAEIPRRRRR